MFYVAHVAIYKTALLFLILQPLNWADSGRSVANQDMET